MNLLKKTLTSIVLLSALSSTVSAFEQNGVKEGNNRVSASARISVPDEGDKSITLLGQYGYFLKDDVEVMVDVFSTTNTDTTYLLGLGANYYFAKTPTLTPYVGAQYYHTGMTGNSDLSGNGDKIYVGAHQFLSENFAITPEAGAQFVDFTDYSETYLNVYLTYFFN